MSPVTSDILSPKKPQPGQFDNPYGLPYDTTQFKTAPSTLPPGGVVTQDQFTTTPPPPPPPPPGTLQPPTGIGVRPPPPPPLPRADAFSGLAGAVSTPAIGTATPGGKGGTPPEGGTPGGIPPEQADFLSRFGYMGDMPINPFEQQALDYTSRMAEGAPLETLTPAQTFLSSLAGGEFAPQQQAFQEAVYQPVEERAFTNLERAQKMLGERFAHRGGFFGGQHGTAQAEMAERVLSPLSETLANLNLSGFQGDIASRMGAATGLESMGRTQQAIGGDILSQIMGGGQLLTGREALNRAEIQQAQQRAYQDWQRARQENLMPFQMAMGLLGAQPFENIITPGQESPWSALLGGVGQGIGQIPGLVAAASSKEFKKDISEIEEEEENRIFEQMKKAPLFNYRYKFEPDETAKHIGLITEESPEELTLFDKKAVGLYEYISMLHAAVKVMGRKIEKLEKGD